MHAASQPATLGSTRAVSPQVIPRHHPSLSRYLFHALEGQGKLAMSRLMHAASQPAMLGTNSAAQPAGDRKVALSFLLSLPMPLSTPRPLRPAASNCFVFCQRVQYKNSTSLASPRASYAHRPPTVAVAHERRAASLTTCVSIISAGHRQKERGRRQGAGYRTIRAAAVGGGDAITSSL